MNYRYFFKVVDIFIHHHEALWVFLKIEMQENFRRFKKRELWSIDESCKKRAVDSIAKQVGLKFASKTGDGYDKIRLEHRNKSTDFIIKRSFIR